MDMSSSDDEFGSKSKDKAFLPKVRQPSITVPLTFDDKDGEEEEEYQPKYDDNQSEGVQPAAELSSSLEK